MGREADYKKLGEILVEQGTISKEQLTNALTAQSKEGGYLGEVLLRTGMVTENDIVIALATQFNFPYLPIANFEINPQAIKAVPAELVERYLFIPIDKIKDILTLVMSDPADDTAIQAIEKATQCKLQLFVATVTEIKTAIKRHYNIVFPDDEKADKNVSKISFRHTKDRKPNRA